MPRKTAACTQDINYRPILIGIPLWVSGSTSNIQLAASKCNAATQFYLMEMKQ